MNFELETKAVAIAQTFIDKANAIWGRGFTLPRITWDIRSKRVAGLAYRNEWRIALNRGFAHEDHLWSATIGHEIAHLVTMKIYPYASQAHGPEWKMVMRRLGLEAARCHTMKRLGASHNYKCPTCQTVFDLSPIIHRRMMGGQKRYCMKPLCRSARNPIVNCDGAETTST